VSGQFTPQWWAIKLRARCEMTVWVEAETSQEAREKYENYEYEEASPWEPIGPEKALQPKPAPHFEPTRDNP
jgi:hypothetical protein